MSSPHVSAIAFAQPLVIQHCLTLSSCCRKSDLKGLYSSTYVWKLTYKIQIHNCEGKLQWNSNNSRLTGSHHFGSVHNLAEGCLRHNAYDLEENLGKAVKSTENR